MKITFLVLTIFSTIAFADNGSVVVSTGQLPACLQTIDSKEIYPRWKVKNVCAFPVEVLWCWKAVPPAWVNANNSCAKTGFVSSGVIERDAIYEFANRPYLESKFKPAAMLTVDKVCNVSKSKPDRCKPG